MNTGYQPNRNANETRSSADADKPPRRVYSSVKVTKHSTIPYVRYAFLLCNSNFVFKMVYGFLLVFFSNFVPKSHRFF